MDVLEKLPLDLFIKTITYLPFEKVKEICESNKEVSEYCVNPKYSNSWKLLIDNTFGSLPNYSKNLEILSNKYKTYNDSGVKSKIYNYYVYTEFVKLLDPITQAMIYYRQRDTDSFNKFSDDNKFYAMVLLGNVEEMNKYEVDNKEVYYDLLNNSLPYKTSKEIFDIVSQDELIGQIQKNNTRMVHFLLSRGIKPFPPITAITGAFNNQNQEIIEMLLHYGVDIRDIDTRIVNNRPDYNRNCQGIRRCIPILPGSDEYWENKGYKVVSFPELDNKSFICITKGYTPTLKRSADGLIVCGKN